MPLRYLFGPVTAAFAEQNLYRQRQAGEKGGLCLFSFSENQHTRWQEPFSGCNRTVAARPPSEEDGPMSKQVNFFAAVEDAAAFHSWLLSTFPDMAVVFDVSAHHLAAGGVLQPIAAELLGIQIACLVPAWATDRLTYCPPSSMVTLDLFDSPVLEYSPSVVEADKGCIKVGRIYWPYHGELEPAEKKQIAMIFRWVQSHTELVPRCGRWRMFPQAKRFRFLCPWVGDSFPNPLFNH